MFRRQSSPTATVSIAGEIAVDKWVALGKKRERETDSLCAISLSPVTMLQEGRQIFMGEALLFLCNKKLGGRWESIREVDFLGEIN